MWITLLIVGTAVCPAAEPASWDTWSDTWTATDALGRSLPGPRECGPQVQQFFTVRESWAWSKGHKWFGDGRDKLCRRTGHSRGRLCYTRVESGVTMSTLLLLSLLFADPSPQAPERPVIPSAAQVFPLDRVRLLDGSFRENMLRDEKYLLSLDPDRMLHMFRVTAGLPSTAKPLGGWEEPKCEVRGHAVGHYVSALALMYAATGHQPLKARAVYMVAELAKCQAALPEHGCTPGYVSAFPESFFDRVDARKPVWAPWYTFHKILAGLIDVYVHCGDRQALDVAVKAAEWVKSRVDRLAPEQFQAMLDTEHGGMDEALANLYGLTGDKEHLRLAHAFDHKKVFDPLAGGEDKLDGLHANTQIPKITGAARIYELSGEKRYHEVARTFWNRVALHRSYSIGGHSDGEHFFPIDKSSRHLSPATAETCNTYNMLKLTRHLFTWNPSAETMDFYERALFNHILASQEPTHGMMIYFASLKPGHFKTYSTPEDSFWCCVGTGMENHARYGEMIYAHDDHALYVNLFIAAELDWSEKGLRVRQETRFPEADTTRLVLRVKQPTSVAVKIRYPAWARQGIRVSVNGEAASVSGRPGSYVTIERMWRDGDRIEVQLPMQLHLEAMPDDPRTVALLYGPIVLAGQLGTENLPNPAAKRQLDLAATPVPPVPALVCEPGDLVQHVSAVPGKALHFRTEGVGRPRDVELAPFYSTHYQRYTVYWRLRTEAQLRAEEANKAAEEVRRKALEGRTIDMVLPAEAASERAHRQQGERTSAGQFAERGWRHASDGGWFSYQLKTLPGAPLTLRCTYWGSDGGSRRFDILVDGQKIATQELKRLKPDEFVDVDYPIPPALVEGKKAVTVRFQAHARMTAGGVFEVRVLRPEPGKANGKP